MTSILTLVVLGIVLVDGECQTDCGCIDNSCWNEMSKYSNTAVTYSNKAVIQF